MITIYLSSEALSHTTNDKVDEQGQQIMKEININSMSKAEKAIFKRLKTFLGTFMPEKRFFITTVNNWWTGDIVGYYVSFEVDADTIYLERGLNGEKQKTIG